MQLVGLQNMMGWAGISFVVIRLSFVSVALDQDALGISLRIRQAAGSIPCLSS